MEWRPDGVIEVLTGDYRLVRYPDWALDPTLPAAEVTRSQSSRARGTAGPVIDEVTARVRGWRLPGVAWWVSSQTLPPDTEQTLRARGGKQIDAVHVLARELGDDPPDLNVPDDVTVELARDERTFRAAAMVTVRGWGRKQPTGAALDRELAEVIDDLATWSSFRVLACVDGQPASSGGCTLRGDVARQTIAQLWGAVTLREFRRRGAYRAVLAERLRLAHAHGAALALVKGRVDTSGPILLRAGFADYGEERCYWLPVT